jgi:hypothetical protein
LLIGKFAREFPRIGANETLNEPRGRNPFFTTLVAKFQKTGIFRRALGRISIRANWRRFAGKTPYPGLLQIAIRAGALMAI